MPTATTRAASSRRARLGSSEGARSEAHGPAGRSALHRRHFPTWEALAPHPCSTRRRGGDCDDAPRRRTPPSREPSRPRKAAFPSWADTAPLKRARVLFSSKQLLDAGASTRSRRSSRASMARCSRRRAGRAHARHRGRRVRVRHSAPLKGRAQRQRRRRHRQLVAAPAASASAPASRRSTSRPWCRCGCFRSRSRAATRSC